MIEYSDSERLEYQEYFDFLKRCDLGSQYPRKGFESRIPKLLKNVPICITARDQDSLLIGICFGITDFAYFLFLTDLGVVRSHVGQGIGKKLLTLAHEKAGGQADITITTISNRNALGFYESCGMRTQNELVVKFCSDSEEFVVT